MFPRLFVGLREQFTKTVPRQGRASLEENPIKVKTSSRPHTADDFMRQDLISSTWN